MCWKHFDKGLISDSRMYDFTPEDINKVQRVSTDCGLFFTSSKVYCAKIILSIVSFVTAIAAMVTGGIVSITKDPGKAKDFFKQIGSGKWETYKEMLTKMISKTNLVELAESSYGYYDFVGQILDIVEMKTTSIYTTFFVNSCFFDE
jgi:hypothetical protein